MNTRNAAIAGLIILIVVILGFFAWQERATTNAAIPATRVATSTPALATGTTTIISVSPSGQVIAPAGYTVTPVTAGASNPTAPSYKAPLIFAASAGLISDEEASMQTQFAQAQAAIAQTPTDFNAWIELGDLRKEAGDYTGAEADWQYMSALYPTNTVSNANLADLYTNYLREYPKAAAAYQAAIKNNPTQAYLYDNLFSLYTNQYPQSPAMITAMLKAGIAANPNATELKADLAKYQ